MELISSLSLLVVAAGVMWFFVWLINEIYKK